MQKKPKTGDLICRGTKFDFELVPLKAPRAAQCITILHGRLGLADGGLCGLAIDYGQLVGGGFGFNGENKLRRKIWIVKGT